jgi:hypothetical protein
MFSRSNQEVLLKCHITERKNEEDKTKKERRHNLKNKRQ